jgi:hypothetical protein
LIGLQLAREEVSRGSDLRIARFSKMGEGIGVDFAIADYLCGNIRFVFERRFRSRNIWSLFLRACRVAASRRRTSSVDVINGGSRYCVCVLPNLIFDVVLILTDLISPDGASILKMNDVRRRRNGGEKR